MYIASKMAKDINENIIMPYGMKAEVQEGAFGKITVEIVIGEN